MSATPQPFPRTRHLLLAYAIGLVPALALAIGQPVWSRVDEAAHYDVVAQYAAGVYPHDSVTTIRPQTLEVMRRTGVYGFVVDNAYAKPDAGFQPMPSGLSDAAHVLWIRRHGYQYSYEAFQPPLYYLLALPAWMAGNSAGGAFGALYAVRVFDALLAALLAPLSLLIALRLWPGNRSAAWAAAVLAGFVPGVALNLTSVTNDVLVSVLGAACVLAALGGSWTRRRIVLLGVLFGAALLAKTTAVALAPALAIALLEKRRGGGMRSLVSVGAIAAAMVTPWLASNLVIYGELITTSEQLAMSAFPARTADPGFWSVSTLHAFVTFWAGDPFLSLATSVPLAYLAAFLVALAAAGLVRAYGQPASPISRPAAVILTAAAAGAALVSITSPLLAAFNAPGRLAYVGLAPAIALVSCGLWLELPSRRLQRAMVGVFCLVSVVGLSLLGTESPPAITNPGNPMVARAQTLLAEGGLHQVTADLQYCALDTSGDAWLHIRLVNMGSAPAEWSQGVEVREGGHTVAVSDYSRSTPLPAAIPPGGFISGWLWLGPASRIPRSATTTVVFRGIATDGYRSIGDLEIASTLC